MRWWGVTLSVELVFVESLSPGGCAKYELYLSPEPTTMLGREKGKRGFDLNDIPEPAAQMGCMGERCRKSCRRYDGLPY